MPAPRTTRPPSGPWLRRRRRHERRFRRGVGRFRQTGARPGGWDARPDPVRHAGRRGGPLAEAEGYRVPRWSEEDFGALLLRRRPQGSRESRLQLRRRAPRPGRPAARTGQAHAAYASKGARGPLEPLAAPAAGGSEHAPQAGEALIAGGVTVAQIDQIQMV